MCAHCQFGKAHKSTKLNNNIIKDSIEHPGDLIHMDQVVSSIPGRWLTASRRPSKQKCTTVSIFFDSISKNIFVEFQKGATAEESITPKIKVE